MRKGAKGSESKRQKRRLQKRSEASDSELRNFTGFAFFILLSDDSQVLVHCCSDVVCGLT